MLHKCYTSQQVWWETKLCIKIPCVQLYLPLLKELITIFYHLVSSAYQTDAMATGKVTHNVSSKCIRHSSIIITPAYYIL